MPHVARVVGMQTNRRSPVESCHSLQSTPRSEKGGSTIFYVRLLFDDRPQPFGSGRRNPYHSPLPNWLLRADLTRRSQAGRGPRSYGAKNILDLSKRFL